ncbi:10548_t:CDS:2 [Rhizophagus irregularis]|nr:10548_t:CDS:2 [Rhizophagus irregularis]
MDSSLKCNLMTLYSYLNNKNDGSYIFISKTKSIVNHQVIAKNENASWEIIHNIESDNVLSEAETQEQLNKINSGDYYDIVTELKLSKEDNAVYREQIKGLEKDNRPLSDKLNSLTVDYERISMMYEDSIVENENEMANRIIDFFNDNKVVDIVEIEDFQNFEVTYNREEANRKILLREKEIRRGIDCALLKFEENTQNSSNSSPKR